MSHQAKNLEAKPPKQNEKPENEESKDIPGKKRGRRQKHGSSHKKVKFNFS